jgi:acyl-CoA synthetase (AMP-forming)/AMP-acid ligase II
VTAPDARRGAARRARSDACTIADLVAAAAERSPEAAAVVFPDHRSTYGALVEDAAGVARSLLAMGVGRGDRVGLLMPNCPAFVSVLLGASTVGAVVVPVNARFRVAELAFVVAHAGLRVLFTTDLVADHVDFVGILHQAIPGLSEAPQPQALQLPAVPALQSVVLMGRSSPSGLLSEERFAAMAVSVPEDAVERAAERVRVRDPAIMMYTSGTTAQPKGCVLGHEAVVRNARAARRRLALRPDDRFWDPLPLFHMGAFLPWLACADAGATFCTMTHFEPGEALAMIGRERATVLYPTFPTITQALLHHPDVASTELGQVRAMLNVAPPDLLRSMQAALPHAVQIGSYGCTEVGGVASYNELDDTVEQRLETCGRPFPGIELRIVGEDGADLPAGQPGEILVRGYSLFDGYHNDPALTAAVLDEDGWFHTGDIGVLDASGRIAYRGRTKDMLKVGGENVAAAEIESFLCTHPAVKLAQVVGVPDERLVEVPAAFVELHTGQHLTAEEVVAYCTGRIAGFKVPRHVRFVEEWPMSATKIQKFRLREALLAELGGNPLAGLGGESHAGPGDTPPG